MNRVKSIFFATALVVVMTWTAGCTNVIQQLRARDQLNKGVIAFSNANYARAVENFKRAIDMDPDFMNARLYLATAYMSQYVPGAPSEENKRNADAATSGFMEVLRREPNNLLAIESLGSLAFNQQRLDEAKKWYGNLIELDKTKKTAYYTLGVINWTKCFQPQTEAWAKLGMRPEDPGPIKDKKAREELRAKNEQVVKEGIEMLQKALEVDPDYDDAMAYMNLLFRQQAFIAETVEENKKLAAQADEWMQKVLATRKKKSERPALKSS